MTQGEERTRWKVRAERVVGQKSHIRLSITSVELPDGVTFDQYALLTAAQSAS